MTKYQPLEDCLASRSESEVAMTFDEIERVIGETLPASAGRREWWSNNEQSSVITRSWKRAGFVSAQVDMAGRKLVFRRVRASASADATGIAEARPAYASRPLHPLSGALRGLINVARGTDLSAPADRDWGSRSE